MGRGILSASARADGVGTSELTINFADGKSAVYPSVPADLANACELDPSLYNSEIRGKKFSGPSFSGIVDQVTTADFIEAVIDIAELL